MIEAYDVHVFENRKGELCASVTLPSGERTPATQLTGVEAQAFQLVQVWCRDLRERQKKGVVT